MSDFSLGVVGLGTMGANLARNAASNGADVAVYNRTTEKMTKFIEEHKDEGSFIPCEKLEDLINALRSPRAILIMVKAGDAVDAVIEELLPHLQKGDILIDGGNSHYKNTERRTTHLDEKGIYFIGMGVSNGVGAAFGLKYLKKGGVVDVLLADGDAEEGQVIEAFRLAAHLKLDNLVVHGDFNDIQLSGMPSKTVASDFASIAAACGWQVIEVQNGNHPGQVKAALAACHGEPDEPSRGVALRRAQDDTARPTFICYYTTMGYGVTVMEEGSNTGKENFHGTPLKQEVADEALKALPPLEELVKEYEKYQKEEKKRYTAKSRVQTDIELEARSYKRIITEEKGAARKDFGAVHLKNFMENDERIFILHADLAGSGGFEEVEKSFPDRVINVGVAEANMYMMAAGMRQVGLLPVTYTFAAFGTNEARANARLIDINCGHTRCGVLHDCTHSGLSVGEDGETHQEQNYLNIPFRHTQVWMPADSNQAAALAERAMELIAEGHTSVYVFSPRTGHEQIKKEDGSLFFDKDYVFDGKADMLRGNGDMTDDITIISTGITTHAALKAVNQLNACRTERRRSATRNGSLVSARDDTALSVRLLNVSSIRPLDASAIIQAALETTHLIVIEDHNIDGGLATQVADVIADFALPCTLRRLGLHQYFPSGPASDLMTMAGLDSDSIVDAVEDEVRTEVCVGEDVFVSCMHELIDNMRLSRFEEQVTPFIDRLLQEKGYMNFLRKYFASRACLKSKLPSNKELLAKIQQ